jgi:hypothetical protein
VRPLVFLVITSFDRSLGRVSRAAAAAANEVERPRTPEGEAGT